MKKACTYAIIIIMLTIFLWYWESFSKTESSKITIHECIHNNSERLELKFVTDSLVNFEVFFIRNAPQKCVNPHFPAIHIRTNTNCNAWLHIIYTDASLKNLRMFIDSEDPLKANSIYPFYTLESDFYDAPLWTYSFFSKALSFWRGHAFALHINHRNKTIMNLGGIEWGFKLSFLKINPTAIDPKLLNQNDWNIAWQLIKEKLPEYRLVDS